MKPRGYQKETDSTRLCIINIVAEIKNQRTKVGETFQKIRKQNHTKEKGTQRTNSDYQASQKEENGEDRWT